MVDDMWQKNVTRAHQFTECNLHELWKTNHVIFYNQVMKHWYTGYALANLFLESCINEFNPSVSGIW